MHLTEEYIINSYKKKASESKTRKITECSAVLTHEIYIHKTFFFDLALLASVQNKNHSLVCTLSLENPSKAI